MLVQELLGHATIAMTLDTYFFLPARRREQPGRGRGPAPLEATARSHLVHPGPGYTLGPHCESAFYLQIKEF